MTVKLVGSTSGSVSLQAPASTTGGAHRVLTLPDVDGTIATTATAGGLYASYALLADIKANSVAGGGTLTSGDWRTRDLNTELHDADGIVSISSNQFTLQAGTYRIAATTPSYQTDRHQAALYNVTDSSYVQFGPVAYTNNNDNITTESFLRTRFTISGAKVFELRHRAQTTEATYGFGVGLANYWTGSSIFAVVEIFKEN